MRQMNNTCVGMSEFECATGHSLTVGDLVRHCQMNGQWSGAPAVCERVTCPPLLVDTSLVELTQHGTRFGDRVEMRCVAGAEYHSGSQELHCQGDGTWGGGSVLECAVVTMATVPAMSVTSDDARHKEVMALAIVGWALFTISLVLILAIILLAKKGLLYRTQKFHNDNLAGNNG